MPISLYIVLKKARKLSNPLSISLDLIIYNYNSIAILGRLLKSYRDVTYAVSYNLRALERLGRTTKSNTYSNR
jgi:hypothetical protein